MFRLHTLVTPSFVVLSAFAFLAGCAAPAERDSSEIAESEDNLTFGSTPLWGGTYTTETTYYHAGSTAPSFFDPPRAEPVRPRIKQISATGFVIEFKTIDGRLAGLQEVPCKVTAGHAFACDDVRPVGPPLGLSIDGRHLPPFWSPPRAFEASLYQRTTYVGVITGRQAFVTTETTTTSCEGADSECAALGAFLATPFGADPLVQGPQTAIRLHQRVAR